MSNANNITTLFIPDPNGGQPQMFKVMGTSKLPVQLSSSIAGSSNAGIKAFLKASSSSEQSPQIIQGSKLQNRLITLPSKQQNVNVQGIRPVVIPANSVQLKSNPADNFQNNLLSSLRASSPMVIRAQNVMSMTQVNTPTSTIQSFVRQPTKQGNQMTNVVTDVGGTPTIIQAHLKAQGSSLRPQPSFTLKPQALLGQKRSEIVFQQQRATTYTDGQSNSDIVFQQQKAKSVDEQNNIQLRHHLSQFSTNPVQNSKLAQPLMLSKSQSSTISQLTTTSPPKSLMSASILDHSGVRKRHHFDIDYNVENKRRRTTEKSGKGLRHFSMKVCEKVQAKGTTSYNEVADELVNEFTEQNRSNSPTDGANYDQKNIRRRVYDALNVLMAMNIISKEKKEIHWLGLPTNSAQECGRLQLEQKKRTERIKIKTQQLQDLILQQIAFKNLVERNRKLETEYGSPSPNSAIQLPFIIVNTSKKTVIDCSISNDKTEYLFNFNDAFEIHDDIEVLKRMGMALGLERGSCSRSDLEKARSLVPKALQSYVTELAESNPSSESQNDPTLAMQDDLTKVYLDDEFDFSFARGSSTGDYDGEHSGSNQLSRASSLTSLNNDHRIESESTSSFGDDDDSDIEIG